MPGEDAAVRNDVVGDKRVEIKVREPGPVAEPLVCDPTGKILVDAEFKIHPRIKRPRRTPQQPAIPVGVFLANCQDIGFLRHIPAGPVVVPALVDGHDLAQLALANHLPHALLVRIAQPLRPHLHHSIAFHNRISSKLGVFERIGHRLFAIAVLARAHHLRQDPRMLEIARSDHHRVEIFALEQFAEMYHRLVTSKGESI